MGDASGIEQSIDADYLIQTLSRLAQISTAVPLGSQTYMEADDPLLVEYVQRVIRPEITRLGYYDVLDVPKNNLLVRLGSRESGRALLIQNYTVAQHHNLMDDPFSGKIANARELGHDEPCVFGQGVSQNKAHQAVMLAVLKLLRERNVQLRGRLYWAVNNEGRSSHACSEAVVAALDRKPSFGILQLGGLSISLGNRGRVDALVHVEGKATHSSSPWLGLSAIEGAYEVMSRLRTLQWSDRHPAFEPRHAIVYKLLFEPLAPHTLPSDAYLTVDRRLLPGDDPEAAVDEIRAAIGDLTPYRVTVEQGPFMLPAMVEPDDPGVQALQAAHAAVTGGPAETYYGQGTFDAGGPCSLGIPTVMYGAKGGSGLTGDDFVPISDALTEARVLARLIVSELS
jgi:acetylornithine deacetylase/succinyl-diaminopimelate desuccinylase-like protein